MISGDVADGSFNITYVDNEEEIEHEENIPWLFQRPQIADDVENFQAVSAKPTAAYHCNLMH